MNLHETLHNYWLTFRQIPLFTEIHNVERM